MHWMHAFGTNDLSIKTPELYGTRCRLVPFGPRHLSERYVDWLNDPSTMRYSENRHRSLTHQDCVAYLKCMTEAANFFWAIELTSADGLHVGNITVYANWPNRTGDLSIMIGTADVRGTGIGADAARTACIWLLQEGGLRKVTAGTMATNAPMLALMDSIGMVIEARLARHFIWEGQEIDLVLGAKFSASST